MRKGSYVLVDFHVLVDLINSNQSLTPEQKLLWDEYLNKIENLADKPDTAQAIVPDKYLEFRPDPEFKESFTDRILKFFKLK